MILLTSRWRCKRRLRHLSFDFSDNFDVELKSLTHDMDDGSFFQDSETREDHEVGRTEPSTHLF